MCPADSESRSCVIKHSGREACDEGKLPKRAAAMRDAARATCELARPFEVRKDSTFSLILTVSRAARSVSRTAKQRCSILPPPAFEIDATGWLWAARQGQGIAHPVAPDVVVTASSYVCLLKASHRRCKSATLMISGSAKQGPAPVTKSELILSI